MGLCFTSKETFVAGLKNIHLPSTVTPGVSDGEGRERSNNPRNTSLGQSQFVQTTDYGKWAPHAHHVGAPRPHPAVTSVAAFGIETKNNKT